MNETELRRRLGAFRAPDEEKSAARRWPAVEGAYDAREPVPTPPRRRWPVVALAAGLAVVAAALTPPGRAVLTEMRTRIGVEASRPGLFSLPADGRLLVQSARGLWVVDRNGSKRLLAGYREGSWSPFGLYVVAARANELAALEPDGDVRWTLARRQVRLPRWGGTTTDTRIAYLSGRSLRVVAGDGSGDRVLARRVEPVAPAWRPGGRHLLAAVGADGRVRIWDADARAVVARAREPAGRLRELAWSPDGSRLYARGDGADAVAVFDARARLLRLEAGMRGPLLLPGESKWIQAMAISPRDGTLAVARRVGRRNVVHAAERSGLRAMFTGAGTISDVAWSPDGRWLLVAWADADQWVFIRSTEVSRIRAVSNITKQFGGGSFPTLAGWCCP